MEIQNYENIKIFKENRSSFKETSRDSDSGEIKYMTNSEVQVINFDGVKDDYISKMKLSDIPCSCDALYIANNERIFLIEFKNGVVNRKKAYNVYNKIYDSLLIFNDIIGENISFCRNNLFFILVYNEEKNPKEIISKYMHKKAKENHAEFNLDKFEKIYFKKVLTYTEKEFEDSFLSKIENKN